MDRGVVLTVWLVRPALPSFPMRAVISTRINDLSKTPSRPALLLSSGERASGGARGTKLRRGPGLAGLPLLLIFALCLGCGQASDSARSTFQFDGEPLAQKVSETSGNEASSAEALASQQGGVALSPEDRKIIYTTTVGLVVADYNQFEAEVPKLISRHGGFVASSETDRRYRDRQSGTWVVRIPVNRYDDFLNGINSLGFAESRSEQAQDVTEEYVDVEARIKNKRLLEQRIVTMLEERTGKLSDVLEIERELARVREEIERMEGRLRYLKDRTRLATITIQCREQREYKPAQAPTLGSRIQESWGDSTGSLRLTAENVLVGLIAMIPWMVVLGLPSVLALRSIRRRWRVAKT